MEKLNDVRIKIWYLFLWKIIFFFVLKKKKRYRIYEGINFRKKKIYIYKFCHKWPTILCKRFCYDNGIQIRHRNFLRYHQSRLESTNESSCVTLAILIIERLRCMNLCVNSVRDVGYVTYYINLFIQQWRI